MNRIIGVVGGLLVLILSFCAAQAWGGPVRIAIIVDRDKAACLSDEVLKSAVRMVYDVGGSLALGGMDGEFARVDMPAPPHKLLVAPDFSRLNAFAKNDSTRAFNSRIAKAEAINQHRRDLAKRGFEELRVRAAAILVGRDTSIIRGTRAALVYLSESGPEQRRFLVAVTSAIEPSRQSSSRLEVPNATGCEAIVVNEGEAGVLLKLKPKLATSLVGAMAMLKQEVQ
jgi:hypothetical protein